MLFRCEKCCADDRCCQHFCNKMCCNQVKWVVPGYTDFFTGVGVDCRAGLTVPATGLQIRVRVRCGGYNSEQDCDTDCEIVEVEYSEDNGETWTTTPPESAAGITWSIYCSGGESQPDSQHSPQRCAAITTLNAEQCAAADGEPCSLPCADCGLPCGPEPTEWRIVDDYDGSVWFAGYVIPNPLYTGEGEAFCTDPCSEWGGGPSHPRWLLEHFPFVTNECPYTPAGWRRTGGAWLHLDVLGCDGANWKRVENWCTAYIGGYGFHWNFIDATNPCDVSDGFWAYIGNTLSAGPGGFFMQSPPGCACLRDPSTGQPIIKSIYNNGGGPYSCPKCNQYLGATGCSTGLEYLEHGEAVRFTGAVDNEGSNLWNWDDSLGRSPAGFWPTGAIVVAGELRSWRGGTGYNSGNYHPNWSVLSFPSVSLEPDAVLAISLTTETLTVDDATIAELMLDSYGTPKYCANGGQYEVRIVVTGSATFTNGGENLAKGEDGTAEWLVFPDATAGVTGACVFETGSKNVGTIRGTCTFSDDASNDGKIAGDCTFADTAANNGSIWGNCTFSGDATNEGTITGDCTFTETAANNDTITGNCEFSGDSVNNGTITGDATFSGNAVNAGTVTGNATFIGNATNTGTVDGDATFNGSSSNSGTVTGDATFGDTASMAGNVTGTATFTDDACWSSGTAGAFDPDPPPAC